MSKKCRAYSESRLGLEPSDNRKAFYAGWDAALRERLAQPAQPSKPWVSLTDMERAEVQYEAHKKGLTPLEFMELHEAKMREKNA